MIEKTFIKTEEAAAILGVSKHTLAGWRRKRAEGEKDMGPDFVHIGYKTVAYRREDVEKFARAKNYIIE